jgi:hypothetical protein
MKSKILVVGALLLLAAAGDAGTLTIPWHTVDAGGGLSTSLDGRFTVIGTVGQPDAGTLTGASFELFGGFWFPQAACDCYLAIQHIGSSVVVTWPATFRGCALETATELGPTPGTTVWSPVGVALVGATYTYTAPIGTAAQFFRLTGL